MLVTFTFIIHTPEFSTYTWNNYQNIGINLYFFDIRDMETGFLNFHDDEHFSDFSLSLDHQHNLLGESQSSILQMVDGDFDYVESLGFDSNDALWETEQELNGDHAILPVSGVAGVIPKIENIKEDFAKVLTDWQEHIGYLQASEIEEDIDMVHLDMGLHLNSSSVDNVFENRQRSTEKVRSNYISYEESPKHLNNILSNHNKCNFNYHKTHSVSESDQSEKEIGVVELDLMRDVKSIIGFMHARRHLITPFKEHNSKTIDVNTISIKQEPIEIIVKEESENLVEEIFSNGFSRTINSELLKMNKKKYSRRHKGELSRKRHKAVKVSNEIITKFSKKSQRDNQFKNFVYESNNYKNIPSTSEKAPVLEAGDVKSLLEQFEATEAASISSRNFGTTSKSIAFNFPVNKSEVTILKKFVDSPDIKLHQDIRDSLTKKVVDRIKVTNGISNLNSRINGFVQLDHDYCNNSISFLSSNSCNSSNSDSYNSNCFEHKNEYTRKICDSQEKILSKEKFCKEKDEGTGEHLKFINYKVSLIDRPNWMYSGSKNDSDFESGNSSNVSEEEVSMTKIKGPVQEAITKESKELTKISSPINLLDKTKISLLNKINITSMKPLYEMKIQSALATSILQLRKDVFTKTESLDTYKPTQMVSVLKKPSEALVSPQKNLRNNLKESIVSTKNSLNNQVQNIIIQNTKDIKLFEQKERKTPCRKLNLAEYRSRCERNRNNGNHTNSPIQPMVLMYIHHVSTNTEPLNDYPDNSVWSEREIVSVLKSKLEIQEQKFKPKRSTTDRGMQTTETVFGFSFHNNKYKELKEDRELDNKKEQKHQIMKNVIDEINSNDAAFVKNEFITYKLINNKVINGKIKSVEITNNEISEDNIEVVDIDFVNNKEITIQSKRSRSCSCSLSRNRGIKSLHRCHSRSHSCTHNNRSFDRNRINRCDQGCNKSRSRSRSMNSIRSRSRRSKSCARCQAKRSRISHRCNSVNSSSSWSSRSRSPRYRFFSRSRSGLRSSSSRSTSSRYSSCSRCSSRSNFGRSKWSSYRRKERRKCRRSYDRLKRHSSGSSHDYINWRRSPLPSYRSPYDEWYIKEKQRQVEERRVIYVGRLKEGITKLELQRRFETFGAVIDISLHFRERGHNYGFVTFAYKNDAYEAVEHGNDDPSLPRYDLCFGGRRAFCKVKYADLDGAASNSLGGNRGSIFKPEEKNTFDLLLKEAQAKLHKRKV